MVIEGTDTGAVSTCVWRLPAFSCHNTVMPSKCTRLSLSLAALLALLPVTASLEQPVSSLKDYLADYGLQDYADKIKSKGVDTAADIEWLSDHDIDSLWIPVVKRNILKDISNLKKAQRRAERKAEQQAQRWHMRLFADVVTTVETLIRGFFLGFGLSTVYEMIFVSKDFFLATDDISLRVRRMGTRGLCLGLAVALIMVGSAIIVPSSLRGDWMKGSRQLGGEW